MIKLSDFYDYIREMNVLDDRPVEDNTVSISYYRLPKAVSDVIKEFAPLSEKKVLLSRRDIFSEPDTRKKIIKILVWGYSNGNRGNALNTLLHSLDDLTLFFDRYKEREVTEEVIRELFSFPHIRISTASKILYFMRVTIDGFPAIVVDSRVQEALPLFEELQRLPKGDNEGSYMRTVTEIGRIARSNNLESDQIEYFLFNAGKVWSSHIAEVFSKMKEEQVKRADSAFLDRLLKTDREKTPASMNSKSVRTASKDLIPGRKVVNGFHCQIGDFHLFRGVEKGFDYCEVLLDSDTDIATLLDKSFLSSFEKRGRTSLNYRYHRFTNESEQEKAHFYETARTALKKIVDRL